MIRVEKNNQGGASSAPAKMQNYTEKADDAAQQVFQCSHCGQQFTNTRNLHNHHWCLTDSEVTFCALQSGLEYENELREAEKAKQMEANRVNALLQRQKWNLPSLPSPPIVIVGTGQKNRNGNGLAVGAER